MSKTESTRIAKYDELKKGFHALSQDFASLQAQLVELQEQAQSSANMHGISVAVNRALILISKDHNDLSMDTLNRYLAEADILVGQNAPLQARVEEKVIEEFIANAEAAAEEAETRQAESTEQEAIMKAAVQEAVNDFRSQGETSDT